MLFAQHMPELGLQHTTWYEAHVPMLTVSCCVDVVPTELNHFPKGLPLAGRKGLFASRGSKERCPSAAETARFSVELSEGFTCGLGLEAGRALAEQAEAPVPKLFWQLLEVDTDSDFAGHPKTSQILCVPHGLQGRTLQLTSKTDF